MNHLIELPGAELHIWRTTCLRGTGFPASLVLRLAATDAAAAADRLGLAEAELARARVAASEALRRVGSTDRELAVSLRRLKKRIQRDDILPDTGTAADVELAALRTARERVVAAAKAYHEAFGPSRAAVSAAIREMARDPRLREAVTWQNRGALATAFGSLLRASSDAPRSHDRKHEGLVARYLQRYCTKNDTIGFFGPVGWARWSEHGEALVVRPGRELLAAREVYFEQWPIDLLADRLARDPRHAPWMRPRRLPFVRLEGVTAYSATGGEEELTTESAALLRACDGGRSARELAAEHGGEPRVLEGLRALREKKLLTWTYELPLAWKPDETLRALVARIDDAGLRSEALAPLDELDARRRDAAAAAGDAEKLFAALSELDETFTRLTGAPPTRQAGSMYAARQLAFEDCRRDVDVTLGPAVLAALGPPLSLVLTSARWLSFEIARIYREALRSLYGELSSRRKTATVRFADLWFRSQRLLFGAKDRPLDVVVAGLQERWSSVLTLPPDARRVAFRVDELRPRVDELFAAPCPGWRSARHHSPDVMIAAAGADAVCRGDFLLVLGEIHPALNTFNSAGFIAQHPRPRELYEAFEGDLPEPRLASVTPKDWPASTVRTSSPLTTPSTYLLETGVDPAPGPRERVLAVADLPLEERDGALVTRARDGTVIDVMEIFGETIAGLVLPSFRMLPPSAHQPRVTIDRLVVVRESWRVPASDVPFAGEADDEARFLTARRWARELGLPRFFFVKSAIEVKPMFVDTDNPIFVGMLAKLARAAKEHVAGETDLVFSEMLPTLDEAWLPDAAGERYVSELRIIAVDPR